MEPEKRDRVTARKDRVASRWSFLEDEADACAVVTRRMEVLYLNAQASSLVPLSWFGCRCWQVFPVTEESCAARCAAVSAVATGDGIVYCEETLYSPQGEPMTLGVAVVPLKVSGVDEEQAILLLRPQVADVCEEIFREDLIKRAAIISRIPNR